MSQALDPAEPVEAAILPIASPVGIGDLHRGDPLGVLEPDVGEFVPGYESFGWVGIGVPRNTPVEIIEKLSVEINAGLADTKIRARLADLGGTPLAGSPADFGKLISEQTDRWAKVIRAANIKPD